MSVLVRAVTGLSQKLFLRAGISCFATWSPVHSTSRLTFRKRIFLLPCYTLVRESVNAVSLALSVTPSLLSGYWNINQLSIDYAFRPRLRSRLTQGGRTCPWKPWSYGVTDSHRHLATHTGILTSVCSSTAYAIPSPLYRTLPYHLN